MSVRQATRDDLAAVARIERACFPHDALPLLSFVQYLDLFPGTFLVAEWEGKCAGFAIGGASAFAPGEAWVLDIAVDPAARKRGVAQELLRTLVEALGSRKIRATVSPHNTPSAALFARAGFTVERRVTDYFGPGEDRDVLVLQPRSDPQHG